MAAYVARRLFHSIYVVLGVATITFFLVRLTGDPVTLMLPLDATPEDAARLRAALGLDKPLLVQFFTFLVSLARGDLGTSLRYGLPNLELVLERLPATLELSFAALAFALLLAFPVGILSAVRPGSLIDHLGTVLALVGQAMPVFWLGLMLILNFSVRLQWLPSFGRGTFAHLIMPSIALGMYSAALITRLLRSGMLETLGLDFIRTAWAKGLNTPSVVLKHALRNAVIPVLTVIGLQTGGLLGGAIVTETVFAWPGMGQLVVQAIAHRDFPLVQAALIIIALMFVLVNLVVDVLYAVVDPRIRYS
ncbi:MAG: ABC transporter permease [Limnochordales bacterium]